MKFRYKLFKDEEIAKLLPGSGKGLRVLDLGCGKGELSRTFHNNGFEVTAADLCPEQFKTEAISCKRVDCNKRLPFEDESFDIVISSEMYEHLENHMFFAGGCRRIIKKNGVLVLTTPNILNLKSRIRYLFTGFTSGVMNPVTALPFNPTNTHIGCEPLYLIFSIFGYNGFSAERISSVTWKESAMVWLWLYPFIWFFTLVIMLKEKNPIQHHANKTLHAMLLSFDILLGRSLIIKFIKQ